MAQYAIYSAIEKNHKYPHRRVALYLGAGKGKSRVAATMGLIALKGTNISKVVYIYPNAYLRHREVDHF